MFKMTDELRQLLLDWIYANLASSRLRDDLIELCQEQETAVGDDLPLPLVALTLLVEVTR